VLVEIIKKQEVAEGSPGSSSTRTKLKQQIQKGWLKTSSQSLTPFFSYGTINT